MYARVTTLQLDPARIDDAVSGLESNDLPTWRELDGWQGFNLIVNRESGKVVGTSYWASKEQMDASEETVKEARRRATETGGGSGEPEVEVFEVALQA